MTWTTFDINGVTKDVSHLRSKTITVELKNQQVELHLRYGSHCFSDEKSNGFRLPFKGDERYWSEERYEKSLQLPEQMEQKFIDGYAVAYYNHRRNGEQYHYTELDGYYIFFEISKPPNTKNQLNIKIISAYERDAWGRIPSGKPYKVRWILTERLAQRQILKKRPKAKKHQ